MFVTLFLLFLQPSTQLHYRWLLPLLSRTLALARSYALDERVELLNTVRRHLNTERKNEATRGKGKGKQKQKQELGQRGDRPYDG